MSQIWTVWRFFWLDFAAEDEGAKDTTNVEQALNVSCAWPGEHDYAPGGFVRVVNRTVRNCIYRGALAPRHWGLESRRVWARCRCVPQSLARRWSKWLIWEGCHFHEQSIQWWEKKTESLQYLLPVWSSFRILVATTTDIWRWNEANKQHWHNGWNCFTHVYSVM